QRSCFVAWHPPHLRISDAIGTIGIGIGTRISIVRRRRRCRRAARLRSTFSEPDSHASGPCSSGRSWQSPRNRNFSRQKMGPLCEHACSQSRTCFCVYLPGRPAIGALTVDRQAVTWSGPPPMFQPPLLATHRGYTKSTSLSNFSDTSAEQSINRDYIYPCQCGHDLVATLSRQMARRRKAKTLGETLCVDGCQTDRRPGGNYFRSLADRSVR